MKKLFLYTLLALPCAVSAETALFVGDSHSVGPFGWKMDELLRGAGYETGTYASCGSIARWWETGKQTPCGFYFRGPDGKVEKGQKGPTPIFEDLLGRMKPDIVVVELGANYAQVESDEFAVKDMRKLARRITASGARCFWITKPDARKNAESIPRILQLTYKAAEEDCEIFDSTRVTRYPAEGGDGVHYWFKEGLPIANAWAQAAFDSLRAWANGPE